MNGMEIEIDFELPEIAPGVILTVPANVGQIYRQSGTVMLEPFHSWVELSTCGSQAAPSPEPSEQ